MRADMQKVFQTKQQLVAQSHENEMVAEVCRNTEGGVRGGRLGWAGVG